MTRIRAQRASRSLLPWLPWHPGLFTPSAVTKINALAPSPLPKHEASSRKRRARAKLPSERKFRCRGANPNRRIARGPLSYASRTRRGSVAGLVPWVHVMRLIDAADFSRE